MTPEYVADVVVRARDTIDAQNAEIAKLKGDLSVLETGVGLLRTYVCAVSSHNASCDADCNEGASCGWAGLLRRTKRRCAECPVRFKIDVMPAKGSA